MIVNNFVAPI